MDIDYIFECLGMPLPLDSSQHFLEEFAEALCKEAQDNVSHIELLTHLNMGLIQRLEVLRGRLASHMASK
ncbi:hypothetical protein ACCD10_22845 [Pseudomonas sp. Pseusp122]|uniref:hypothetical protein n=1 Tax=unclassified Pseudomonas TaxID=196821 RepID=UPI0039A724C5